MITVKPDNDFRVGDPITLTSTGAAVLDTAYTDAAVVSAVDSSANTVTVTQEDGTAIGTLSGDGADNGGHIEMRFSPAKGICECREFSISMSRTALDVSTLPCAPSASAGSQKFPQPKKNQPGPPEITGTMTLLITDNEEALGTRLMESSYLNNQDGAAVELYMDMHSDGATPPQPDKPNSSFIAGEVQFTDFGTTVNLDNATEAEVSFTMWKCTHWLGMEIN